MASSESLEVFLSTTKPLGKGVTQVAFPSQNTQWVIKFSKIHNPSIYSSFDRVLGWDGIRDGRINAHCQLMERLLHEINSSSPYLHLPRNLHTTFLPAELFPSKHLDQVPDDFLCQRYQDVCVQVVVQERVHGVTLSHALKNFSDHWNKDDWTSLIVQIACSLYQMQCSLGFVQWDSHAQNIMIHVADNPVSFAYPVGMTFVTTPKSRLVVKWLDGSSVTLCKAMSQIDARRACAQRAWFNRYVRNHYDKYDFVVPVGVHDWMNVLVCVFYVLKSKSGHMLSEYFDLVMQDTLSIAFSHAYGKEMAMQDVLDSVKQDQVDQGCWNVPHAFWDCDETMMRSVCTRLFASIMTDCIGDAILVNAPPMLYKHVLKHDVVSHMRFVALALIRSCRSRMCIEDVMSQPWFYALRESYERGEWFIPIANKQMFVSSFVKEPNAMIRKMDSVLANAVESSSSSSVHDKQSLGVAWLLSRA